MMKRSVRVVTLLVSTLCLAWSAAAAGLTTLQGTLSVVGNEPFTYLQLRTEQDGLYRVTGPAADELRAVGPGYVVKVVGRLAAGAAPLAGILEASQYRVVSVQTPAGARKPFVGRLAVDEDETYLVTEDLVVYLLQGSPVQSLQPLTGKKVCVVGKASPGWGKNRRLTVEFYNPLEK